MKYPRGHRKKHKRLRKGDGSHISVSSTQTFATSSNDRGKSSVTEENRIANERAVENFMQRIQNISMEGGNNHLEVRTTTVENSSLPQTMTSNLRRYKNLQRRQQRKAAVERVNQLVARSSGEATEPLQLFTGETTSVHRSSNLHIRRSYYLGTSGKISSNSTVVHFITIMRKFNFVQFHGMPGFKSWGLLSQQSVIS